LADAVITDHLGAGFEDQLEQYSPTPKPDKDKDKAAKPGDATEPPAETKADDAKTEAKPDDAKPVETKPVETKPVTAVTAAPAAATDKAKEEKQAAPKHGGLDPNDILGDDALPPAKPHKAKPEPDDKPNTPSLLGKTENTLVSPSSFSAFARARGTVFLVDAKSRQVVWSTYAPPSNFASKEMNRTANDIVSRIKHDLKHNK
jgi:hypothetical protein